MSKECENVIANYKDIVNIVEMPKKGGIGLSESLRHICKLAQKKAAKEDVAEYTKEICY